mmetsp:Transcript_29737/g.61099  ORF Transcript_29737/g.61099 Transcript_29737/m.61099 type:complete len:213 (+) Transcript_29737:92-730(+)
MAAKTAQKGPPISPEAVEVVEANKELIIEFHTLVGGRVTAIHDLFNQIALTNNMPGIPAKVVGQLLVLTVEQTKHPGGPVVTPTQLLNAFTTMVEPKDAKETFERKVMSSVREKVERLNNAKKVFPQIKGPLTDLHTKVEGDTAKLYAWFQSLLPPEVQPKFSQDIFCAHVMHTTPGSPAIPLQHFLNGIESNMDETDTAEKIIAAVELHMA